MHRPDERHVEHTVVGHSLGKLLHTAAVVLADTDGDAQQQVVVDQPVIDPHLHSGGFITEELPDQTPCVDPAVLAPLLLEVRELAHHMGVEARTRDVGHVTALAVVRLLVRDHAHVLQERIPFADRLHGVLVAVRNTERAHPVVARTDGDHRKQHLIGADLLLDEQPVDHLVQGAVAPDDDDMPIPLVDGRHGKFRGVELMFREDRFAEYLRIAQVARYLREMVKPAAASGHGIDDDEPFDLSGFQSTLTFWGCCAACRP